MGEKSKMIQNANKWLEIKKTLSKYSERDLIGLISDVFFNHLEHCLHTFTSYGKQVKNIQI